MSEPSGETCFGQEIPELRFEGEAGALHAGMWIALDALFYDSNNARDSEIRLSEARPFLEASSGDFEGYVELDVVGVDSPDNLFEAWAAWRPVEAFGLEAGLLRIALGSEAATHLMDRPTLGPSFVPSLTQRYDWGVRANGTPAKGLWYELGGTFGHGFGLEGQRLSSPMVSGRLVVHPFRLFGGEKEGTAGLLDGFHFGLAQAVLFDGDDPVIVTSPFQQTLFTTPKLGGDGGSWTTVEVGYTAGPVQVGFERAEGSYDDVLVDGAEEDIDQLTATSFTVMWNLSGEPRGWDRGAWVNSTGAREDTLAFTGLPEGIWTLGARFSNMDLDRTLFDGGYTTYDPSTQEARTFSASLFWQPCSRLRFGAQFTTINADHELTTLGGTSRDDSYALRMELTF